MDGMRILYTIDGDGSLEFFSQDDARAAALTGMATDEDYAIPQRIRSCTQQWDSSLRLWRSVTRPTVCETVWPEGTVADDDE